MTTYLPTSSTGQPGMENNAQSGHVAVNPHFLPREFVPKVMWEQDVLTGYRPIQEPWIYYIKSMFWIHNETGNIWTHLVAPLFSLILVYHCSHEIDFSTDISAHGFLVFIISANIMQLLSAIAHLVHSRSVLTHYIMFSLDYSGIALFGYGQGIMLYYCSGDALFYTIVGKSFRFIVSLFALNATVCMVMARTVLDNVDLRRTLLLVGGGGLLLVVGQFPIFFREYGCIIQGSHLCYKENMYHHILVHFIAILVALSFSLHLPEKAYPGKFDIWGGSHQLFHIVVTCGVNAISYAVYLDLNTMPRHVLNLAQPDLRTIWLDFSIFIFSNSVVLLLIFFKYKNYKAREKKTN